MSATVLYMSMSLEGFVAGPNEGPGRARRRRSGSRLALVATPRLPARALGRPSRIKCNKSRAGAVYSE